MNMQTQAAPVHQAQPVHTMGGIPLTMMKQINLVNGLPGFEDLHSFVLAELENYAPFCALQSMEEPEISMLVIDAKLLSIWKNVEIPPRDLQILDIEKSGDSEQFIILKIQQGSQEFTGNIKAPIVFNRKTGAANQVILDNAEFSVEHPMNNEIL